MIIAVAGPYTAPTKEEKQQNLDRLNQVAARLFEMGQIPLIGVNAALPVVGQIESPEDAGGIMKISMALLDACEALLIIAESPGANKERDHMLSKGLPVYTRLDEVPGAKRTSL